MRKPMAEVLIGARRVGDGHPAFVIAEAGVNHDGDIERAHRLVDAAADARVDAVKFQTFDPDALVSAEAPKAQYQARLTDPTEGQRAMLRRLTLSHADHVALKRHAEERGLLFLSTPFDLASADFLEELGLPAFKVSSGDLTNHPFLVHLARKGRPVLLSTGMSDEGEVEAAVAALRAARVQLALFQCTSSYPAPPEAANLRVIDTYRARFGVPVGYSDHTLGLEIALAAIARGATLLEKHLTLDRGLPGPDHAASLEPDDFRRLVEQLRAVERALGSETKAVHACERDAQRVARKSVFVTRDLPAGAVLGVEDLAARRPGTGMSPARIEGLIGRRTKAAIGGEAMLREEDLE
jgi:N-acetylneuraminate synthase/N,N'-diacetyllegionaminate synthase